jgi:hypothetical protein
VVFCGRPPSVNVVTFLARLATTVKPDSGALLRSTA